MSQWVVGRGPWAWPTTFYYFYYYCTYTYYYPLPFLISSSLLPSLLYPLSLSSLRSFLLSPLLVGLCSVLRGEEFVCGIGRAKIC
jgi:hypothetical protein